MLKNGFRRTRKDSMSRYFEHPRNASPISWIISPIYNGLII